MSEVLAFMLGVIILMTLFCFMFVKEKAEERRRKIEEERKKIIRYKVIGYKNTHCYKLVRVDKDN